MPSSAEVGAPSSSSDPSPPAAAGAHGSLPTPVGAAVDAAAAKDAAAAIPRRDGAGATDDDADDDDESYHPEESSNDLTVLSCAGLILADCMGTGILALPNDVRIVLGDAWGVLFVLINLPINLYAGYILSESARHVEMTTPATGGGDGAALPPPIGYHGRCSSYDTVQSVNMEDHGDGGAEDVADADAENAHGDEGGGQQAQQQHSPSTATPLEVDVYQRSPAAVTGPARHRGGHSGHKPSPVPTSDEADDPTDRASDLDDAAGSRHGPDPSTDPHANMSTFDFIGVTGALFGVRSHVRTAVLCTYYTNIFLVLGNYILVMSHSVRAIIGEGNICIPTAGIVASTLMFGLSQLNTMAKLGKSATAISLTALLIVVIQCLTALDQSYATGIVAGDGGGSGMGERRSLQGAGQDGEHSFLRKMAALSSIGFAVGSQKLFLNIRHEMAEPDKSPISLGIALCVFGAAYITVIQLSGTDPPSFLFDAIPVGTLSHRIAGFMLWVHVSVSYAINSQALCSSIDRLSFHRFDLGRCELHSKPRVRWAVLTLVVAVSSYFVANAVPFFKDLVALIGALTSVPLTLLLPAVLYRRVWGVPIVWPPVQVPYPSYALLVFATVFLACGLLGALSSIEMDWSSHGAPFSCE